MKYNSKYKDYLKESQEINEAFKEIGTFQGITIEKSKHVSQRRGKSSHPRDGNTSRTKYERIINLAIEKGMMIGDKSNHITWEKNNKHYGFVISPSSRGKSVIVTFFLGFNRKLFTKNSNVYKVEV